MEQSGAILLADFYVGIVRADPLGEVGSNATVLSDAADIHVPAG